jgi:putative PIN family toxin of toxin-antitoxin system
MSIPSPAAVSELLLTSNLPGLVLDTNVVLDWLLFRNPCVAALVSAVTGRQVRWLATTAMRDELDHVLARGLAAARQADAAVLLGIWDTHAVVLPDPPRHRLLCTDPDDQKFIDLALSAHAQWLISRDRAVLKLRHRAAPLGLAVLAPERWSIGA